LPLRQAERMLTSGRLYCAAELLEMGVIDAVCERGAGVEAVRAHIASHVRRRAAHCLVHDALERLQPTDFTEMARLAQEWVNMALALSAEELHVMDLLIGLQRGRG
jgi:DSF synthase